MKKLLPLLALLALPLMAGCAPNQKFVDTKILPVLSALTLNDVEYMTLSQGDERYYGKSSLAIVMESEIGYIFVDDDVAILFSIYVDEKKLNSFTVWSFDIFYINTTNNVKVYWEFMHEDEWFTEDYTPETIDMNYLKFSEALVKLTNNDLVYLVERLEEF